MCWGEKDGSLGTHLRKLEDAGYLAVDKTYRDRRPVTWYRLTSARPAAPGAARRKSDPPYRPRAVDAVSVTGREALPTGPLRPLDAREPGSALPASARRR